MLHNQKSSHLPHKWCHVLEFSLTPQEISLHFQLSTLILCPYSLYGQVGRRVIHLIPTPSHVRYCFTQSISSVLDETPVIGIVPPRGESQSIPSVLDEIPVISVVPPEENPDFPSLVLSSSTSCSPLLRSTPSLSVLPVRVSRRSSAPYVVLPSVRSPFVSSSRPIFPVPLQALILMAFPVTSMVPLEGTV